MHPGIHGLGTPHVWCSEEYPILSGGTLLPLPLDRAPDICLAKLVCKVAEFNHLVGSQVHAQGVYWWNGAGSETPAFGFEELPSGAVYLCQRIGGGTIVVMRDFGTNLDSITNASWRVVVTCIWFSP